MTKGKLHLWSACIGNLFEHYDSALFGFLSPFLAPLIFPTHDPMTALILTYAMIPLGMLARPLGAIVFGYIGDTLGRSRALFLTLAGMSLVSACIAVSPTYAQVGILSPVIFCIGRVLQNFLASGETMGGAIYLLENSSEKKHDILSGLYNSSTIGGILLASAGVSFLSKDLDWQWRGLYVFGCLTGVFGCIVRSQSYSIPSSEKSPRSIRQLGSIIWKNKKFFLLIVLSSGFAYANYSMSLVLLNGYIPLISSFSKADMMKINTLLLLIDFSALPLFGWIASKISREKMMIAAAAGVLFGAAPLLLLLKSTTLMSIIGIRIVFVLLGVAFFAPFHAWAQKIVPEKYKYVLLSLGYALGSQLIGGPTSAVSLWLYKTTGKVSSLSWYWIALASVTTLTLTISFLAQKQKAKVST